MKRVGHLFEQVYDMENLKLAHQNAKKGKGWYKEVIEIDKNPDLHLKKLQDMLKNKTYKTSEYEIFIKKDGLKEREIYKLPYFPDRICQWALMLVIEPYLLNTFTKDTYSAIPGRGIHLCLKRLQKAIQTDIPNTQYCLKLDVKKFYPSINHDVLKRKYRRLFKDKHLLWLIDEIIDSTEGDTGIPIGNYLSQYSGNFYLSQFDHWIKEDKRIKYYFRYMDDVVILGDSKKELHQLRREIERLFNQRLGLTVKDNWQVFPTFKRGIDFVGYRFFLNYTLLRKSTAKQYKRKMTSIMKKIQRGDDMNYSEWCSINSYYGWLKFCNGFRLYEKYSNPLKRFERNYYYNYVQGKGGTT